MTNQERCFGCFSPQSAEGFCPECGFDGNKEVSSPFHLPLGTTLENKYLLGRVLGQGGFGITYLAWDLNLKLKLAIKEYFPQELASRAAGHSQIIAYTGTSNQDYNYGIDKFLQEAQTLAQFEGHPNIVSVRDFFRANGTAYFVMSYVEGITLKDHLDNSGGRLTFKQANAVIMPVLDALREVHAVGILHRDISPDNIFIDKRGRVILLDFGAARQALSEHGRSLSIVLKPGYAPEEQYRTRGEQGPWTDIYATAATFYHLLTGKQPPEALERLIEDQLETPSAQGAELSSHQEQTLLKALSVRASDRYQKVEDFQTALLKSGTPATPPPVPPALNAETVKPPLPQFQGAAAIPAGGPPPVVAKPQAGRSDGPPPVQPRKAITGSSLQTEAVVPVNPLTAQEVASSPAGTDTLIQKISKNRLYLITGAAIALVVLVVALLIFNSGLLRTTPKEISSFSLDPQEVELMFGDDEYTLNTMIEPKSLSDALIVWYSSDESVATVDLLGRVKAVGSGVALITAAIIDTDFEAVTRVTVSGISGEVKDHSYEHGLYSGTLENGIPHGTGTIVWQNGSPLDPDMIEYSGEWRQGLFNGRGTLVYNNGEIYDGIFEAGLFHGQGKYTFPNGDFYDGDYLYGFITGQGRFTWVDGGEYSGEVLNGYFHGQGTYTWASGEKYVGEFQNDKKHGQGTYTWPNGHKYVGTYQEEVEHGYGTYYWPSGDRYSGGFRNGKMHGQGTLTFADGEVVKGRWENDEYVDE